MSQNKEIHLKKSRSIFNIGDSYRGSQRLKRKVKKKKKLRNTRKETKILYYLIQFNDANYKIKIK
jgi:hypothetical protein